MGVLWLLAVLLGVLVAWGVHIEARARWRHGWHRIGWRWLTGRAWHGRQVDPDGEWPWPGRWFWRLHRAKRALARWAVAAAVLADFACWVRFPQVTLLANFGACCAMLAGLLVAGVLLALYWRHYRRFVRPARRALHERHGLGQRRPQIARDRSQVRVALPQAWAGDGKERAAVVETLTAKTGIESPEASWRLAGPAPMLTLTVSKPPPALVTLADVRHAIAAAKPDELVWGLGKHGKVVKSSLSGDSPHIGLSMGSGAGKSLTIRAMIAQMLYHGAIALVLDYKQISQHWARELPNVSIVRHPHEIHAALLWLGREINRRNAVALAGADLEGNVHSVVGPRLIIAGEELNAAMKALRIYWRQLRDEDRSLPVRSPALDSLDLVNLMGRQVLMNMMYVGQRLSNKASGGDGDIRESIGVLALGRYKASTWKMLAEDHAMPPPTRKPGRFQIVDDGVREVQGIRLSALEARELALAGVVSALPAGMPGAARVSPATAMALAGPDHGFVPETPPAVPVLPDLVTLSEAVEQGIVSRGLHAVRKASQRPGFPRHRGLRGTARLYDALDLAVWDES